jgi:hypothetical protein
MLTDLSFKPGDIIVCLNARPELVAVGHRPIDLAESRAVLKSAMRWQTKPELHTSPSTAIVPSSHSAFGRRELGVNPPNMAEPVPVGSGASAGTAQCTKCSYRRGTPATKHLPPCPNKATERGTR